MCPNKCTPPLTQRLPPGGQLLGYPMLRCQVALLPPVLYKNVQWGQKHLDKQLCLCAKWVYSLCQGRYLLTLLSRPVLESLSRGRRQEVEGAALVALALLHPVGKLVLRVRNVGSVL